MDSVSSGVGADMAKPAAFEHIARHVRDVQRSAAFYQSVLGLERMPDPFEDDRHIFLRFGAHSELHLIGGAAAVSEQDIHVHIAFTVPSVTAFVERLNQLQVQYVNSKGQPGKATLRRDGVKQVYFRGPDGYWIEVNDATK